MAFGRPYELHSPADAAESANPRKAEVARGDKRQRRAYGRLLVPAAYRRRRREAIARARRAGPSEQAARGGMSIGQATVHIGNRPLGLATKVDVA